MSKTRTQVVAGEGPLDARIALVGEAPGYNEDVDGRPFVGKAGQHLDKLLVEAGLKREEVYLTNILHCRPPDNNIRAVPDSLITCPSLWLSKELNQLTELRVLVAIGGTSGIKWFPGKSVTEMSKLARAFYSMDSRFPAVIVIGSWHPSAALRPGGGRWIDESIVESLRRAKRYANTN